MTETAMPCFHCGEPCPDATTFQIQQGSDSFAVCCRGCKAVAELIIASGLDRYYRFREGEALKAGEDLDALEQAWRACDERESLWGAATSDGWRELLLQVEGVHCAACAWLIRSRLEPLPGIEQVSVDLDSGYARIIWQPRQQRLSRLALELGRVGYRPHLPVAGAEEHGRLLERRLALRRLGVAGLGMMQVMMYAVGLYAGDALGIGPAARTFLEWTSLLVSIPVVFYSGRVFFTGAINSLRAGRPGMDVPVALAIAVAFIASCVNFLRGTGQVYFDSVVMFVFFLSVARYIQLSGRHRSLQVGQALARLMPEWAERLDGAGPNRVPATDLREGDRVRVRPGNVFPADGLLEEGQTDVNEALLTGESCSRRRYPGDPVVGGSINRSQPVTMRVTAAGDASTLSALGRMLVHSRARHSALVSMADRVAGGFVVAVLVLALATGTWWMTHDPALAMPAVLAVLVVSCPCALSLATPASLAAARRKLLRHGILLTRGDALEALAIADTAVFDKTGTLTLGEPEIAAITINPARTGHSEAVVRQIAASLEAHSSHPLAGAFAGETALSAVADIRSCEHQGLSGRIGGTPFRLGSAAFAGVEANGPDTVDDGVWLADSRSWIARFEFRDALRPGSREAMHALRAAGLELHINSGDATGVVGRVADRFGIGSWRARQSPEMKMARVTELQEQGRTVLMVGDGVNDAPVLSAADVSMTVQGATELANSVADLVLTGRTLAGVVVARDVAVRARAVVRQNLAWAITYNILAVPLAASGMLQPWMAALGMSASSLLVVANAARLNRGGVRMDGRAAPATRVAAA